MAVHRRTVRLINASFEEALDSSPRAMMHRICNLGQCFFQLVKKCPFEKSENQFFCPKDINFEFNGLYLWTKTGLVTL